MKRILLLLAFGAVLYVFHVTVGDQVPTHESYPLVLAFFVIQTLVLFRLDALTTEQLKVQMSMVKMGVRLLTALGFVFYINTVFKDSMNHALTQFIIFYLTFMTFEIIMALSNLRRN